MFAGNHCALRFLGEQTIENAADILVDRLPEALDGLVNLQKPSLELGKDAGEARRWRDPLAQILLEPARKLLMMEHL